MPSFEKKMNMLWHGAVHLFIHKQKSVTFEALLTRGLLRNGQKLIMTFFGPIFFSSRLIREECYNNEAKQMSYSTLKTIPPLQNSLGKQYKI